MIPEIGNFTLVVALVVSMLLAVYPLWGAQTNNMTMMKMARPLSVGLFVFTLIAYICLTHSFMTDNFSVINVAQNSNSQLPWYYKMTAVWGSHEGSFLLWVLIFSIWTLAVALFSKGIPQAMVARVLSVLGMVSFSFYLFMLITSNPFDSMLPFFPVDGRDLNPLLQDFGMIIHPPLLYMGYVGFSVAFAFAIAALIGGKLDSTWARWSRPWTIAAWSFLTVGISLGSWWAYYELGWGGWWFWDPVENASFMPWLVGTALMHSLAVTEKRKIFQSWTVLLAIAAFSLSLLGTFLVRSGVLVSVHSFANDPDRGLFILGLLVVVIGGSLLLYAVRASQLKSTGRYDMFSREMMLMGNNVLLIAATIVVLLGTLFPLVHKEIGLGTISIGAPFFNQMFTLLIVPFVLFLGIGPLTRWKSQKPEMLRNQLIFAFILAVSAGFLINMSYDERTYMAWLGLTMSFWIIISSILEVRQRVTSSTRDEPLWPSLKRLSRSHWGMVLGHLGFAVTLIGITLVSNYEMERDVKMVPGQRIQIADYEVLFTGMKEIQGPNYISDMGVFDVFKNGKLVSHLEPEKRFYSVQQMSMTEAGIHTTLTRDLFVAMGEPLDGDSWSVRMYYKPFVVWIWGGTFIMCIGGIFSISDKRYRIKKIAKVKDTISGSSESANEGELAAQSRVQLNSAAQTKGSA